MSVSNRDPTESVFPQRWRRDFETKKMTLYYYRMNVKNTKTDKTIFTLKSHVHVDSEDGYKAVKYSKPKMFKKYTKKPDCAVFFEMCYHDETLTLIDPEILLLYCYHKVCADSELSDENGINYELILKLYIKMREKCKYPTLFDSDIYDRRLVTHTNKCLLHLPSYFDYGKMKHGSFKCSGYWNTIIDFYYRKVKEDSRRF